EITAERDIATLIQALGAPEEDGVRGKAIEILSNSPGAAQKLVAAAKDKNARRRSGAIVALSNMRSAPPESIEIFLAAIKDPATRAAAIYAMGNNGTAARSAVPEITSALDVPD